MLEKIKNALSKAGIAVWQINETVTESAEIYFIRQNEDIRRMKNTRDISVTVMRDFDFDGKVMRGSSGVVIHPGMNTEEIVRKLEIAYDAAQYVKNPVFRLADPVSEASEDKGELSSLTPEEICSVMAEALYAPDRMDDAFINSAEIFASKKREHILSSEGTDVSFGFSRVQGEFVAQCVRGKDVEMYFDFSYDAPDAFALSKLSQEALEIVCDRAKADSTPPAGEYDLILTGKHLYTLFSSYLEKADASMIYAGYSPYKIGDCVQGSDIQGEKLNISLLPVKPYSHDGIPMPERPLLKDGVLQSIPGATRFCRYMGIEPIGSYEAIRLENGSIPLEEMKKKPYILPVAFSDFQMDAMTGRFGGEIRLAYLFDGESTRIVTGGSVSGSLIEKQHNLVFSLDTYKNSLYAGPYAVMIPGASIAGV